MHYTPTVTIKHSPSGFSLLELSIAITIIALLITAVLTGQSIKQRLALNQMIEQVGIINHAETAFKNSYHGLAGDLFNAETYFGQETIGNQTIDNQGDGNGNGNGVLESTLSEPARNEQLLFWQHLQAAGLITGTYDGQTIGTEGLYHSPFSNSYYEARTDSTRSNQLYIRLSTINHTDSGYAALTTQDAFNYDNKYDDGNPTTGSIQARDGTGQTGHCLANDRYTLTYTSGTACQLLFYIE